MELDGPGEADSEVQVRVKVERTEQPASAAASAAVPLSMADAGRGADALMQADNCSVQTEDEKEEEEDSQMSVGAAALPFPIPRPAGSQAGSSAFHVVKFSDYLLLSASATVSSPLADGLMEDGGNTFVATLSTASSASSASSSSTASTTSAFSAPPTSSSGPPVKIRVMLAGPNGLSFPYTLQCAPMDHFFDVLQKARQELRMLPADRLFAVRDEKRTGRDYSRDALAWTNEWRKQVDAAEAAARAGSSVSGENCMGLVLFSCAEQLDKRFLRGPHLPLRLLDSNGAEVQAAPLSAPPAALLRVEHATFYPQGATATAPNGQASHSVTWGSVEVYCQTGCAHSLLCLSCVLVSHVSVVRVRLQQRVLQEDELRELFSLHGQVRSMQRQVDPQEWLVEMATQVQAQTAAARLHRQMEIEIWNGATAQQLEQHAGRTFTQVSSELTFAVALGAKTAASLLQC
jgi:hypothetical protein